jgi:hypothetical protein
MNYHIVGSVMTKDCQNSLYRLKGLKCKHDILKNFSEDLCN